MLFADLVETSRAVAEASGRLQKIARIAALLARVTPDDIEIAVSFLSGTPAQGRIGVAAAAIREARGVAAAAHPTLQLSDVDRVFDRVARTSGRGSAGGKAQVLRELFARATSTEQDFLIRLLFGELRQGALEGVLVEAVAAAVHTDAARVRRAAMLEGSLPRVARAAIVDGPAALDRSIVRPFQPVQPMLAASAEDVTEALGELGEAALDYKLDGARVQVHKLGEEVRVFSRSLRDVTGAVPDVVDAVRRIRADEAILDGEAIVLRPDGTPQPFQITMRRFGRTVDVDRLRTDLPVTPFLFDCLYANGSPLIDEPLSRRVSTLSELVPRELVIPRLVSAGRDQAEAFVKGALAAGHEGIVAKALDAPYAAGRRGQAWLKIKQARTLDLVVLAVEWGNGRRRGLLSNLHLGARDTERGGFVMLGKTFKGLTDDMLARQTKRLLDIEIAREDFTVFVRPELVVEIAFNDIQESPHYPGRLALRFARVKRYRTDKSAVDADTYQTVRDIYKMTTGVEAPAR